MKRTIASEDIWESMILIWEQSNKRVSDFSSTSWNRRRQCLLKLKTILRVPFKLPKCSVHQTRQLRSNIIEELKICSTLRKWVKIWTNNYLFLNDDNDLSYRDRILLNYLTKHRIKHHRASTVYTWYSLVQLFFFFIDQVEVAI